jgi:hypothetical protein
MAKIKINLTDKFIEAFPEAEKIKILPRKKKKALKKKFSKMIICLLNEESNRIIKESLESKIFEDLNYSMEKVLNEMETIKDYK